MSKLNLVCLCTLALAAACAGPSATQQYMGPHVALDGGTGAGTCSNGTTSCGGHCTNLSTDNLHCGACGTSCKLGFTCGGGLCNASGGCPVGQSDCGNGMCADLKSDAANCGACGSACLMAQTCQMGVCADPTNNCGQGQTDCGGGACADLTSDVANCGGCGNACAMGQTCRASLCAGGGGGNDGGMMGGGGMIGCAKTVTCLNACMNNACYMTCEQNATAKGLMLLQAVFTCLSTACPSKNGGVCDKTAQNFSQTNCNNCASAAQMMGGKCSNQIQACFADGGMMNGCPMGQTSCGGACVDTTTDAANCGACGKVCAMNQTCVASACAGGMMGGGMTGCNGEIACTNNCNTNACFNACVANTKNGGNALFTTLLNCLDAACPPTNGGVCDAKAKGYSQTKCNNCYTAAQGNGGKCAKALNACLADGP